jgi:hypothetical protein
MGEFEGDGMVTCWPEEGKRPGVSGELPDPDDEEEVDMDRLRNPSRWIAIGSECFTVLFWSDLFIFLIVCYRRVNLVSRTRENG